MGRRSWRTGATVAVLAASGAFGAACGSDARAGAAVCPGQVEQRLYSGAPSATYLAMSASDGAAIGAVTTDDGAGVLCTVTRVAPGWALTAKHCLRALETPLRVPVRFYDDGPASAAYSVHPHAELDLLLLELADESADGPTLPLNREPVDNWLGRRATAAGRGITETGERGALAYITEPIADVTPAELTIDGAGESGACLGDSGGPLLARAADGSIRVIGVLSEGSTSCLGEDHYVRTDSATAWLESVLPASTVAPAACGEISLEGRCFDGRAVWCEGGSLRADTCATQEDCGWSPEQAGYRCRPPESDPCLARTPSGDATERGCSGAPGGSG